MVLVTFGSRDGEFNVHQFKRIGYNKTFEKTVYSLISTDDITELEMFDSIRIWKNNNVTIEDDLRLIDQLDWNMFCNFKLNVEKLNKLRNFDNSLNILFSIFENQIKNSTEKLKLIKLARIECFNQKIKEQDLKNYMLNDLPF